MVLCYSMGQIYSRKLSMEFQPSAWRKEEEKSSIVGWMHEKDGGFQKMKLNRKGGGGGTK